MRHNVLDLSKQELLNIDSSEQPDDFSTLENVLTMIALLAIIVGATMAVAELL